MSKSEAEKKKVELDSNYIPIDFNSYSIQDKEADFSSKLEDEEKIWRISSLTAFIDADTKILLLPQPESKR